MRRKVKRLMGILLSLVMVLGLMPGMSLTALAYDNNPYASLVNTTTEITFDSKIWYLIEDNSTAADAGTVTLLAKDCVGASEFGSNNTYSGSTVETFVNNWYTNDNNISADAKAAVSGNGMFLLTIAQANAIAQSQNGANVLMCNQYDGTTFNGWWLCSQGLIINYAAFVHGARGNVIDYGSSVLDTLGVRPALKLNLSSVIFSSESMTFSLKEKAVVKTAPIAKKPSYDGSAQELVIAGQAIDGEMQYALGKDSTTAPEASAFTKSIPTATDAGIYYVWYKAKGDQLHWDSEPVPVTASIAQKTLTITAKDQTYSYNGEIQGPGDIVYTEVEQIEKNVDVEGLVGDDALTSITLEGQGQDIGVYKNGIMPGNAVIGDHTDNYDIKYVGGTLTIMSHYSREWVKGKWYNKDGSQTYEPLASWEKDGSDWMYVDDSGWRAENRWQKIDGVWYFFDREGHMTRDAYQKDATGKIWYLTKNGSWDEKEAVAGWTQDDKGWKFVLYGDDYLKNTWKMINGNWYYFKADGYAAQSEFVKGWWLNASCIQSDPVQCSWHKAKKGWWYGGGKWYAKNATYTIDGKAYTFDKNGYCVD